MTRKRFKKLMMAQGMSRNEADAPKTRPEAEAALNDAHKPGGEQDG